MRVSRPESSGVGPAGGVVVAVLADPAFAAIAPEAAFALHNLPGYELGSVVVREGTFCCASRGLAVSLQGRPAHAAQPETGRSPSAALARILGFLEEQGPRVGDSSFATVVGASMGGPAFGTAPGSARVWLTLRAVTDADLDGLHRSVETEVGRLADDAGLGWSASIHDDFPATVNDEDQCARVARVAGRRALRAERPFRWSEDFGRFLQRTPGALVGLGAGRDAVDLHDPAYRFPPELVPIGAELLLEIVADVLGTGVQDSSAR